MPEGKFSDEGKLFHSLGMFIPYQQLCLVGIGEGSTILIGKHQRPQRIITDRHLLSFREDTRSNRGLFVHHIQHVNQIHADWRQGTDQSSLPPTGNILSDRVAKIRILKLAAESPGKQKEYACAPKEIGRSLH